MLQKFAIFPAKQLAISKQVTPLAWSEFNQGNTYILYILKVKHHQCGYAHLIL